MDEIFNQKTETHIQNILINYGQYISKEDVESMVDSGKEQGLTYDLIYLTLKAQLSELAGEEFYCTSSSIWRKHLMYRKMKSIGL